MIAEGQPLQGIYFLESGELEVFKGGVLIAEIHEAGAVFGEMSWLLGAAPTATVKTITPCTFRHVANPAEFFRQNPDATVHMAEILPVGSIRSTATSWKSSISSRTAPTISG
ncbi:MAG: cyclic nucleotide-binding domain-containing protein [Opitutus sp.]|nr:cyclic nucleotide-binding domain-containing protein [Opitutus sp.]